MTRNEGGPAFPQSINPSEYGRGMTMRDYFAAAAMQGFCSVSKWVEEGDVFITAKSAYKMADAMLKERSK